MVNESGVNKFWLLLNIISVLAVYVNIVTETIAIETLLNFVTIGNYTITIIVGYKVLSYMKIILDVRSDIWYGKSKFWVRNGSSMGLVGIYFLFKSGRYYIGLQLLLFYCVVVFVCSKFNNHNQITGS